MKKFFLSLIALMLSVSVFAQAVVHTVQRGETLESIAQKYGVSTQDLLNANPDAKEYLYTGMKISIPAVQKAVANYEEKTVATQTTTSTYTSSTSFSVSDEGFYNMKGKGGFVMGSMISWLFPASDQCQKFNLGFAIEAGYCYFVHKNVYLEGLVGYGLHSYTFKSEYIKGYGSAGGGHLKWHGINLPLHVGGFLPCSEKSALSVYGGPRIQFAVAGEQVTGSGSNEQKVKIGDMKGFSRVTAYVELGLEFQYNDYAWGIVYDLGMGDTHKKENNLSISFRGRVF